ncbi:MAG: rod shape-determining protein MreC [Planctomycetota bacterium]
MAGKRNRVSRRMLFAWFMLGGLIMLFSPQAVTSRFQFAFARIFRWPLRIGRNMPLSVKTELPLKNDFNQKERQYQNYILNLEEELRQKNEMVRQLTGLRTRLRGLEGAKLMPADIITASAEGPRNELIINRGSEDGLRKGFFIIGDNSVIGTITELSGRTSKVRLFSDVSSAAQVNIPGIGINMLMEGNGNGSAKIKMVPVKYKIKAGDTVLVRKKPGYMDIAMVAGVVERCSRDVKNAALWDITVRPVCDITGLNSVAVVIMNPA